MPPSRFFIERASGSLSESCWSGLASIFSPSPFSSLHLLLQRTDLLPQPILLQLSYVGLAAVRGIHRSQVASDALFDLDQAPLHLGGGKVLIPVFARLELAPVDGDDGLREPFQLAAQHDELATHVTDRRPVVLAEVRDGLEVGR